MKRRCLRLVPFVFLLIACTTEKQEAADPDFWELSVVDSVLVREDLFFLNSQAEVKLIGDSLLAVSSYRSPMVAIMTLEGEQVAKIAPGDFPIGTFSPASYDISEYPVVYVLDKRSESVLVFNVETNDLVEKVKLQLPEGKVIRFLGAKFEKLDDGFLVELVSSVYDSFHPDFYRKSGDQIYFFGADGVVRNSMFEYSDEYKAVSGSLSAVSYLSLGDFGDEIALSLPHSKKLTFYSTAGQVIDSVALTESRFFDYTLRGADQIVDFNEMFKSGEGSKVYVPTSHYFNSIQGSGELIFLETWMSNNKGGEDYASFSHLLIYDKASKRWSETISPRNVVDIGMLAGVVNDTLYFYEGSLMKHDEKYIKRAVLRPIEE